MERSPQDDVRLKAYAGTLSCGVLARYLDKGLKTAELWIQGNASSRTQVNFTKFADMLKSLLEEARSLAR